MKLGSFQKTTVIISLSVCVFFLLCVLLIMYNNKKKNTWPPMIPECPDWWIKKGEGDLSKCVNVRNLGTCNEKEKNFNGSEFTGSQGTCNKYRWATNCGISWDGITYGVVNPCN